MIKKTLVYILIFLFSASPAWTQEILELNNKIGKFTIDPATLAISMIPINSTEKIMLTQPSHHFGTLKTLKNTTNKASWDYPKLKMHVKVTTDDQGLCFLFTTDKEQSFQWPIAGLTEKANALIIPDGEGLYVPNRDPFWRKEFEKYPELSLNMPFWAIQYGEAIISTIMTDQDEDSDVQVKQKQSQLYLINTHRFLQRDDFPSYKILIHYTGSSVISPALDYRRLLIEKNKFVSLKQKILENANVNKLLGAFHVWLWGEGKSLDMLQTFRQLDVKQLWLGYDATPVKGGRFNIDKTFVQTAENMGYLVAPYDSFDNAQNPRTSDSLSASWPNHLWPEACIRQPNAAILTGFANRGCYLSAEALRLRESTEKNIAHHVEVMVEKGDNSLFLDCDAAEPLYEDYSKQHPMTRLQDLNDRIERMRYISSDKKLVLGSETGLSWSAPVIAYNNGGFLNFPQAFWPCLKDKLHFGSWWPNSAPRILFKPYHAPTEFIRASYDPRYRLPLYEAVFHDSVISTDRWELNELKIPAIMQTKALLQNLYNIPPIWVLDKKNLAANQHYFTAYYQFFSPLHQMAGLEPLTQFQWLTADRLVQKTQFGNRLILTANFSRKKYETIEAGCIQAQWKEDGSKQTFCPYRAMSKDQVHALFHS